VRVPKCEKLCVIVFDLVLYKGQFKLNKKDEECEHFLTYRNYYVPVFRNTTESNLERGKSSGASAIYDKYHYPGHTTVDFILRKAQLLSGCFFTGKWKEDYLSQGSLFYFHRLFCLRFKGAESHSGDSKPICRRWLDSGEVMYFDCRTASYFSVPWVVEEDVDKWNGIWNMGCIKEGADDSLKSNDQLRRLPDLTKKIRSGIKFKRLFEHEDFFIDIKDGRLAQVSP
jgi:hypothetical protein